MNISCKETLRHLATARSPELAELLKSAPEDERDGRTDLQILADEAAYLLDLYNEPGTTHNLSLKNARAILRETKSGKEMPLLLPAFAPKYSLHHLEECKGIIAEYNRLKCLTRAIAQRAR